MGFLSGIQDFFAAKRIDFLALRYAGQMKDPNIQLGEKVRLLSTLFDENSPSKRQGHRTIRAAWQARDKVALAAADFLPTKPFHDGMAESDLVHYESFCRHIGKAYGEAPYTVFDKLEAVQGDCATRAMYALGGGGGARLHNPDLADVVFDNLRDRNTTHSLILATALAAKRYNPDTPKGFAALHCLSHSLHEFLKQNPGKFDQLFPAVVLHNKNIAITLLRDYFASAAGSQSLNLSHTVPAIVEGMLDEPNPLFRGLVEYAVQKEQASGDPLKITTGMLEQAFSAATNVVGVQSPNPREKFASLLAQITQATGSPSLSPERR